MSLPVSIGDVLLLSKIAYTTYIAFTSGRKSAPREFLEVESELFALSTALRALSELVDKTDNGGSRNPPTGGLAPATSGHEPISVALQSMIANCKDTLKGLEAVIQQYSKAMDSQATPATNTSGKKFGAFFPKRRWHKTLKDNWNRVVWTTEEGNLAALRSQLVVHIVSINLLVSTMQTSKTDSMDERLRAMCETLESIREHQHSLARTADSANQNPISNISSLTINQQVMLKGDIHVEIFGGASAPFPTLNPVVEPTTLLAPRTHKRFPYRNKPTFQVCLENINGDLDVVCPMACVDRDWVPSAKAMITTRGSAKRPRVFVCLCNRSSLNLVSGHAVGDEVTLKGTHEDELGDIYLLPMSFATRIIGSERKWHIFPVGCQKTGTLTTLAIKGVRPTHLEKFERKFVDRLNLNVAMEMMERQKISTFVYHIIDDPENYRTALLDFLGDDSHFKGSIRSVTFSNIVGSKRTEKVDYWKILHYKTIPSVNIKYDVKPRRDGFRCLETAELAIYFGQVDGVQERESIHIHFTIDTGVEDITDNPNRLLMRDIIGFTSHSEEIAGDVILRTSDATALNHLQDSIEEMKAELYVLGLKAPSWDEEVIFQMYAGDIRISDRSITDAEILITWNISHGSQRLLIRSLNGSAYFSKEISGPEELTPVISKLLMGYTVFVEMSDPMKVTIYPGGLVEHGGLHFEIAAFEHVFGIELENLAETSSADLIEFSGDGSETEVIHP